VRKPSVCLAIPTYSFSVCTQKEWLCMYLEGVGLIYSHILSSYADQLAYNVVTVGAPTAYNLKYRNGGLIKWQTTAPYCYAK